MSQTKLYLNRVRTPEKKTKDGFTLIELLVVIAIIAVLLGILMPALRRAKAAAQQTICLTNVRRIAVAANIYLIDNETLPPFRMSRATPNDTVDYVNIYGRIKPRWPWFLDQGIGPAIDPTPYAGGTFGDSDTLIMTNKYFMCPSLKSKKYNPCDIRNGSYGYNYQYLGNTRTVGTSPNLKYANFPVKKIDRPSDTIVIADSQGALLPEDKDGTNMPHGEHAYTLDPPKIARSKNSAAFAHHKRPDIQTAHSPADARHNGRANVSFLDAHAEKKTLEELGYVIGSDGYVIADDPAGSNCLFSGSMRDED